MGKSMSLRLGLMTALWLMLLSGAANADILNLDATVSGCSTCFGGPLATPAGTVVTLINPVKLTLGAGTYTITNAATVNGVKPGANPNFLAFDFEAANASGWAWNFMVATDNGNGTGTLIKGDFVSGTASTQALMAGKTGVQTFDYNTVLPGTSTAGFTDTLVLSRTTTLDFFIDDGFLPDNAAGVSLDINPTSSATVPEPSSVVLLCTVVAGLGGIMWRRNRNQSVRTLSTLWAAEPPFGALCARLSPKKRVHAREDSQH